VIVRLAGAVRCIVLALLASAAPALAATTAPPPLDGVLHWRAIGPFRGGRTVAVSGVPGRPNTFFIAAVNGGIFKTTDAGRTWTPLFDDQPTASIGALAVAPSAPDTIYAGSGEGLQRPDLSVGDGMYKSTDGGTHWTHLGLRDAQQIAKIVVDPADANRLYVAVLGHPYGPNAERGVYRSIDGGATFERVLYANVDTGAVDLALDPRDPRTLYAAMWAARQAPWEIGGSYERPDAGSGLYKSTDGGTTWNRVEGGLPTRAQGIGRIGIAIAASDPQRVYVQADSPSAGGLYRSDDAGATWSRVNTEERIGGRGDDFSGVTADPRNRDVVWVANTSTYRSTDGGRTFVALRGAPGGDDYHTVWLSPDDPLTILLGSDQGATISVNGGASWSSWYNQSTAQMYHVTADDRFPYRVYGGQQESGSAGVLSRGNDGAVTVRDWHPAGTEEYGYSAPDPLHPGIVYGGKVTRYDERTGQSREVGPVLGWRDNPQVRFVRTAPLAFSPADPHALYLAGNVVFKTTDGGEHWKTISPDLTRPAGPAPANLGIFAQTDDAQKAHRGVVYALGLSPLDANVIWAGTDDGLVWRTADGGGHWTNVTPPGLVPWAKVSIVDASPFDRASAYVAVNRFRLDEQRPQLFRTHDGGKTWTEIDRGLDAAPTNVVRADPVRRGMLFAGTERGVWVSYDDGARWSSLRLNLPATSVRDLVVHQNDLAIATHGRGFWILDDITPLRRFETFASQRPALVTPAPAWRVARDTNTDTPLPPDEPFSANPPDGAVLDYSLPRAATRVTLNIRDERGTVLRTLSSEPPANAVDANALDVPAWWITPPVRLDAAAGAHRTVWDLRVATPRAFDPTPTIAAIPHATPVEPQGALVPPGAYSVTLEADGVQSSATLVVRQDPRAAVDPAALQAQFALARAIAASVDATYAQAERVRSQDAQLAGRFRRANGRLAQLLATVETGDGAPTAVQRAAFHSLQRDVDALVRSARKVAASRGTSHT